MTSTTIIANGMAQATNQALTWDGWTEESNATMTTDHPQSNHGLPVLVYRDTAYGPADIPQGVTLVAVRSTTTPDAIAAMRAAGYTVALHAGCSWCSEPLDNPEDWTITEHDVCRETRQSLGR